MLNRDKQSNNTYFVNVGLGVFIVIFIVSLIVILGYTYKSHNDKVGNQMLRQLKSETILKYNNGLNKINGHFDKEMDKSKESELQQSILAEYENLWEQNNDLAGWLVIDGTNIDYPIMYTPDEPEYYLHRAFDGRQSDSGSLFIGEKSAPDSSHVIIYGHNMKNKTMFGSLRLYSDIEYAKEHSIINCDTIYEHRKYEVITAFYTKIYPNDVSDVFRYYWYIDLNSEELFEEYIEQVHKIALYDLGVDVQFGDTILTLSTCSYHTDDGRFVVVARRIE